MHIEHEEGPNSPAYTMDHIPERSEMAKAPSGSPKQSRNSRNSRLQDIQTVRNKLLVMKVKRNDHGGVKTLFQWLLDNQTGLSFNLIALLLLTHLLITKARPYTSKFFMLSQYNSATEKYGAGYDDFYFLTFCVVLFTGLRAGLMKYILAPLAKIWGISKTKDVIRFSEQGWILIYYNLFWPLGMYIYYKSPCFLKMQELWTDWPQREIDGLTKSYILCEWSFYLQQIFVINVESRRKDYWQMLTHHFVTVALIYASYAYHQTRVANLILVLMDFIDLSLPLAKCLKYLGFTTVCDVVLGFFLASWLLTRHFFYPMICWSVYYDALRVITQACYSGTVDDLQGPFTVPNGWSHLFVPFYDPEGTVCISNNIMFVFLCFLLFLEVIMVVWFVIIIRVAIRVVSGKSAEDLRSDDEEEVDVEEAEFQNEIAEPIEEEVGVEAIDLKGWERRTNVKRNASSSGVSSSRHSDHKELLNRIGCEKQIA